MKYRNTRPDDSDYIGRLLQNKVDYNYLSHNAPHKIPQNIERMWLLIKAVVFLLLGALVYFK